ncbi:hypothetical protein D3C75_1162840 [compost metagenome]
MRPFQHAHVKTAGDHKRSSHRNQEKKNSRRKVEINHRTVVALSQQTKQEKVRGDLFTGQAILRFDVG